MGLRRHEKDKFLAAWVGAGHGCFWCGLSFSAGAMAPTLEHFFPKSRGGHDHIQNLVWAHSICNEQRNNAWPTEAEMRRYVVMRGPGALDNLRHFARRLELMMAGASVSEVRARTRIFSPRQFDARASL